MPTSTSDPRSPGDAPHTTTTVTLIGCEHLAAALASHLPSWCHVDTVDRLDEAGAADILVVGAATPVAVATAAGWHPSAIVVGLIDTAAPVSAVVGVLGAGADMCVRGREPAVLAGHLLVSLRRRPPTGEPQPTPPLPRLSR
jgi:hypothetical protein